MKYYPVFLSLKGKKAVVIGGGKVAERKALSLIKAGAVVKVISPKITKTLQRLKENGRIELFKRPYKKGDIDNAFIVIAATSSSETNSIIAGHARSLLNVVDTPSLCNFIVPSLVRRGNLTIAVSTGGSSPALSKAIRRELEKLYDGKFTRYINFLETVRKKALAEITDPKKRKKLLETLASDKMLETLRKEDFESARDKVLRLFNRLLRKCHSRMS
ncbi:MAG: bifunctional precorrin-2 dehydrogenase/sirohydrochlorin ferrochelatase [Nitrospirae bacterium]|nr:bifunctional precorrin-2 dehydrogenase/sirohydrochlorin ferrochelatase [Nitrospirota bacterium]